MKKNLCLFNLYLLICLVSPAQPSHDSFVPQSPAKPKMQVVFVLDATGSMSGLIRTAKDKIWSIVSSLTQTQTAPDIEVGLVFYRDRGDAFVTKKIQLTDSMDLVYSELMVIEAQGGGDGPESVNQGLYEAVEKLQWDQDTSAYKAIFLVGDFEPHMNYSNDVPYYVSCKIAKDRGIVLNTILMGTNKTAEKVWKEIAGCNEGAFVKVDMNVNDIEVNTPYDSVIALINDRLDDLRYYYGRKEILRNGAAYKEKSKATVLHSKAGAKAQRAEYNYNYFNKKSGARQNELLSDISANHIRVDTLSQAELPDEFKNLPREELINVLRQKIQVRDSLQKQLQVEILKRNQFIDAELAKKSKTEVEGSFNNIIFKNIQQQTEKKKIILKGKAKY